MKNGIALILKFAFAAMKIIINLVPIIQSAQITQSVIRKVISMRKT